MLVLPKANISANACYGAGTRPSTTLSGSAPVAQAPLNLLHSRSPASCQRLPALGDITSPVPLLPASSPTVQNSTLQPTHIHFAPNPTVANALPHFSHSFGHSFLPSNRQKNNGADGGSDLFPPWRPCRHAPAAGRVAQAGQGGNDHHRSNRPQLHGCPLWRLDRPWYVSRSRHCPLT